MTKKQKRVETLARHYALCAELGKLTGSLLSGKEISTELMKLERMAHAGATAYCNGEEFHDPANYWRCWRFSHDEGAWDNFCECVEIDLKKILGSVPAGFFVNGDARGYALKLQPGSLPIRLHEDWGRYQILSPALEGV